MLSGRKSVKILDPNLMNINNKNKNNLMVNNLLNDSPIGNNSPILDLEDVVNKRNSQFQRKNIKSAQTIADPS